MATLIHPTAVIHPDAQVHASVDVGPYAVIGEKVSVGAQTVIGAHAVIEGYTKIGDRNRIFPHAAIGLEPQDLKYDGSMSLVDIGNDNAIRECVTINRPTRVGEVTRLGNHNLVMAYAHIAHNCELGDRVIIANSVALAGHVKIESHARISGLVGVHQFVHIGRYAMVGGMSRIERERPALHYGRGQSITSARTQPGLIEAIWHRRRSRRPGIQRTSRRLSYPVSIWPYLERSHQQTRSRLRQ